MPPSGIAASRRTPLGRDFLPDQCATAPPVRLPEPLAARSNLTDREAGGSVTFGSPTTNPVSTRKRPITGDRTTRRAMETSPVSEAKKFLDAADRADAERNKVMGTKIAVAGDAGWNDTTATWPAFLA